MCESNLQCSAVIHYIMGSYSVVSLQFQKILWISSCRGCFRAMCLLKQCAVNAVNVWMKFVSVRMWIICIWYILSFGSYIYNTVISIIFCSFFFPRYSMFSSFGNVISATVFKDKVTGMSKGFGNLLYSRIVLSYTIFEAKGIFRKRLFEASIAINF